MSDAAAVNNNNKPVLDCCGGLNNVDYSKVDMSVLQEALRHIDVSDSRFWFAVIAIIFNPLFWNVLFSDVLSIVVASKMGTEFTLEMQAAWHKFLACVVSALGKQYH